MAHQYPGPFATMLLSDLGADVVVVERPQTGDPTRTVPGFHGSLARGKRSVALDVSSEAGRAAFVALAGRSDALIEGFRPGTMARLGLGHETLRGNDPALVYVSVSGFGQSGPYRDRPGHDLTYQAEAGMLYEHAPPADPATPPAVAIGDLSAGLFAAQAVLVGIVQRERTGEGCYIDVSMFDGLVTLLSAHVGPVINQTGPPGFTYEPGYGVFPTSDGQHIAIGVAHEDRFWRSLCDVTGLEADRDLSATGRLAFAGRLRQRLLDAIAARSAEEWERLLTRADVPFGRVRSLADLPHSPQAIGRRVLTDVRGSGEMHVRQPLVIDGDAPGPKRGPAALGEHTAEVLSEIGIDAATVDELIRSGAAGGGAPSSTADEAES